MPKLVSPRSSGKLKIAYYVNMFLFGGIETSMLEYLRALDSQKYAITLIIAIHMHDLEVLLEQLPSHVVIVRILNDQFMSRNYYLKRKNQLSLIRKIGDVFVAPIRNLYLKKNLKRILKKHDIIVDYALSLTKYTNVTSVKKIGYFHYSLKEYYLSNMNKVADFKLALWDYAKIIILNQHMYTEACEIFPELVDKFALMYNQFDFERIKTLSKAVNEVLPSVDYIVSVGRLEENQKDFTTLIYAYSELRHKFTRQEKLIIIGSGKDHETLQQLINKLNLTDDVILAGHRVNPFPWILRSKLFAFSSKFEGLAMVLVEAMILDKVIVATNCPNGPAEVLLDGLCGELVPVGDFVRLAYAMNSLLSDKLLCERYVGEARLNLDRFDIKKNISQLGALLHAVEGS